jgi:intracellular septation protein A
MKTLFQSASVLLLDLASTFVFLLVLLIMPHFPALAAFSVPIGIGAGMAFGVGQIGFELARKKPVGAIQWVSLFLVFAFGGASLITHDPRFVMIKPSLIYVIVGSVMLKPGWMNRYLPAIAQELVPDVGYVFGYVWAGLMFFSAALNLAAVALHLDVIVWASVIAIYGTASKVTLFLVQYATMRFIGVRRRRAQSAPVLPEGLAAV